MRFLSCAAAAFSIIASGVMVSSLAQSSIEHAKKATTEGGERTGPGKGPFVPARSKSLSLSIADQAFAVAVRPKIAEPEDLLQALEASKSKFNIVLVIIPDPDHSHLGLYFDRAVESIQAACETAGFVFDHHWMPWDVEYVSGEKESDVSKRDGIEARQADAARLPGVLYFRSAREGAAQLLVLLIGEDEASGVNQQMLQSALVIYGKLALPQATLPVLGPTFSGSFASLDSAFRKSSLRPHIVSGAATDDQLIGAFRAKGWDFKTTVHSDAVARSAFVKYFRERMGTHKETLAVLSEFGTAYGKGGSWRGEPGVVGYRFPRGLSRLRNAYPDPENAIAPGGKEAPQAPTPGLRLRWKDERGGREDFVVADTDHSPLSQEAVLTDIAAILNREKTKFATIIASDPMDQLFLIRFLNLNCPDLRIFLLDSDLLFVHDGQELGATGVLAATTYPLTNANQHWVSGTPYDGWQDRNVFSSRFAEGEYTRCWRCYAA